MATANLPKKAAMLFCAVCFLLCACMFFACGQTAGDNSGNGSGSDGNARLEKLYLLDMQTEFWEGERFSYDDLTVFGSYEDGVQDEITDYEVDASAYNGEEAGEYEIKVSVGGVTEKYTVTVMANWKKDGILKILTIGNSFSDDATRYLYDIAVSAGVKKVKFGNLYIGGCSLERHLNNAMNNDSAYEYRVNDSGEWITTENFKMSDAIKSENWDFITFQQASGYSGMKDSYEPLSALEDYVRSLNDTAKFGWHLTWAYQQNSDHPDFKNYGNDQITMYNAIISAVKEKVLTEDRIKKLAPSGTAIQNARTSAYGDTFTRDGYHLTFDFGRYIAGVTLFSSLTGISVDEVTFIPVGLGAEKAAFGRRAAQAALLKPLEITELN